MSSSTVLKAQEALGGFTQAIISGSGSNLLLCYQCQKCTSGCPVVEWMDLTPAQLIHFIKMSLKDKVIRSKTPWICAACKACTTRCPQGIDIAKVMDEVRKYSLKEGVQPPEPDTAALYESMRDNIMLFGRMFEALLVMELKLKTGEYTRDLKLGFEMLKKGKLRIFPSIPGKMGSFRRIFWKAR